MKDGVKVNWIKKKVRMIFISIVIENDSITSEARSLV